MKRVHERGTWTNIALVAPARSDKVVANLDASEIVTGAHPVSRNLVGEIGRKQEIDIVFVVLEVVTQLCRQCVSVR